MLKKVFNKIVLKARFPSVRNDSYHVSRRCQLGRKVRIYKSVSIFDGVTIGDYSYVNAGSIVRSGRIGRYCSIAYNCVIGAGEHPLDRFSTSSRFYRKNKLKQHLTWKEIHSPPVIEDDVWLGANVTVLQGVTIGQGAVIGAGSVVTKDVEPYTVCVGVPARKLKDRQVQEAHQVFIENDWNLMSESEIYHKLGNNLVR